MNTNPIDVLNGIVRRNGGADVDLRNSEVDRYFLFDRIANPADVDLAWAQFPGHQQIRLRAEQIDAVSDIVPGWGYRTPKQSNRCSDEKLIGGKTTTGWRFRCSTPAVVGGRLIAKSCRSNTKNELSSMAC